MHINHKNNLGSDLAVYNRDLLPPSKGSKHYIDVPAELHMKIDISSELEDMTETGYIKRKTDILLEFGTKKVIWILTSAKNVLVAEKGKPWLWMNWDIEVELWNENNFCISKYLLDNGVKTED